MKLGLIIASVMLVFGTVPSSFASIGKADVSRLPDQGFNITNRSQVRKLLAGRSSAVQKTELFLAPLGLAVIFGVALTGSRRKAALNAST